MDFIKSGQFISELRKEKCMTQADLGTILGVTDKTVSKWERGVNIPDILMIREIAKVFNVTADEILNAERDKTGASSVLKFYRNKKLRYFLIGFCSLFVIVFFVLLVYFTNNYDKSKIYKFYNITDNYEISGYIYGVGNDMRVVLDDLILENTEEYEDIKVTGYSTKIYLNNNFAYDRKIDFVDNDYIDFLTLKNEIQKSGVITELINIDLLIDNGFFLIEFFDVNGSSYELKFDFTCHLDLRNNRFFYN